MSKGDLECGQKVLNWVALLAPSVGALQRSPRSRREMARHTHHRTQRKPRFSRSKAAQQQTRR